MCARVDVLRALVADAGDFVLIEQHVADGAGLDAGFAPRRDGSDDLKAVEEHAVDDASEAEEGLPAFLFEFVGGWAFAGVPP
jgi:hypothetical protein